MFNDNAGVIKHNMCHFMEDIVNSVDRVSRFVDENIVSLFLGKPETKRIFIKFIRVNPYRLASLRDHMTDKFFEDKVFEVITEMINNVYHSRMLPMLCQFTPR